jgi:integrase
VLDRDFSGEPRDRKFSNAADAAFERLPQLQCTVLMHRVQHSVDDHELSASMCTQSSSSVLISAEDARRLFASFDRTLLCDVRDRALLGVMVYSFARVSAVIKLRVRDRIDLSSRVCSRAPQRCRI